VTTHSRWRDLERLFDRALDLSEAERSAFLASACPDDPAMRDELARMLRAHGARGGILDHTAAAPPEPLRARAVRALEEQYILDRELGTGGMATVYLARERKHARCVVLKVMHPRAAAHYGGAERFLREVQIAARLAHPHIAPFIDSGEADGLLYYVMPYIEGESLRSRLQRDGRLPLDVALVLLADVANALAYAHEAGVIHRDLKPENVLCAGEHAYLLDFGVAKVQSPLLEEAHLTQEGMAVGTLAYMAPEQLEEGKPVDHRADLYAWGLLAYEMLTGRLPDDFSSDGRSSGAALRRKRPEAPRALTRLIAECLAREPDRRPTDAAMVAARLGSSTGRVISPMSPRRIMLVAAGVVAVLAGAVAVARRGADGSAEIAAAEPRLAGPIAVAALANETGDPALDAWGRMAGDWITQGLQDVGILPVVPWPSALHASEQTRARRAAGEAADPVLVMREQAGAGTVITGSYYLVGDSLLFRVEVADAVARRVLGGPPPVTVPRDSAHLAVRMLRDRLMAAVAIWSSERFATSPDLTRRPPTFDAYRAFDRGIGKHLAQDYRGAIPEFLEAARLDSTFAAPLIYAANDLWNVGEIARVDSVLAVIGTRESSLDPSLQLWTEHIAMRQRGEGTRSLAAIRRAAEVAPGSRVWYALAQTALDTDHPDEALVALQRIDPDRGELRGWSSYWTQLAHALHLTGAYDRELSAARAQRARHPDRRVALVLEARALAAAGLSGAVDSLVEASRALPTATYWSQGAMMVQAGEELTAHGQPEAGARMLRTARAWLLERLALSPGDRSHRYWLGAAHYGLQDWSRAAAVFDELAREYPERLQYRGLAAVSAARNGNVHAEALLGDAPPHLRGEYAYYRARLAAVFGDSARAAALFSEAARLGLDGLPWEHTTSYHDLRLLGGYWISLPRSLRSTETPPSRPAARRTWAIPLPDTIDALTPSRSVPSALP
jgi:serine/threonine-protein kinase